MFSVRRFLNYFVIFGVLVVNDCQACFLSNEHEISSLTTGSSFYKECQCTLPGYTISNLRWLDNNDVPIEPSSMSGPGISPNVYTEVSKIIDENESINLHIQSITKTMSGTYKCITEVDGVPYTQRYTITAYEPLYFYQTPRDQYLVKGQLSPIKCQPKSDTTVVVTWQKEEENGEITELTNEDKYIPGNDGLYINNANENDAGKYKCTAQVIDTNEEVDKYIKVVVYTLPEVKELRPKIGGTIIDKTNQTEQILTAVVGERLTIDCIADGIPHPEYVWNKTLEADTREPSNVTWVQEINTIIFDAIQPEDRGFYTCYAYNVVGFSGSEIFVDVLTPPEITSFPNITQVEGSMIQLICNATGNSEPNISIIYKGKDLDSHLDLLNYDVISNTGFIHLDRAQEGIYVCIATNEVDSAQAAMYLTVLHQPYFDNQVENMWGWNGKTINLSCIQDSNPPASISWRFQGNEILTEQELEINKKLLATLNNMPEHYFTLNIDNETAYGIYECTAKNEFGEATKHIVLKEGFRPEAVQNTSIEDRTATSIIFQISGPDKVNGPPVIGYTATYDEAENFNITDIHVNRTWSIDRPFKLDKLKPNTTYYVKFAAVNEVGFGEWTDYLEFITLEKSVPEPPEWDVNPITLESNSHVLKWKAPDDNGEPIDYYTLRYCSENDEEPCKTQRISPTTELEVSDLEFNTTYRLELVAHNAEGDSTSANISVTVPAPNLDSPTTILSTGAIIGVSIVIVVLCLLLLDVLLLVWRRKGIIATCCYKKDNKRKADVVNSRDKKGLLTNGESGEEAQTASRPNNGHKEYEYNKNTGVVTGKHSAV